MGTVLNDLWNAVMDFNRAVHEAPHCFSSSEVSAAWAKLNDDCASVARRVNHGEHEQAIAELQKQLAAAEAMRDYYMKRAAAGEMLAGGVSMALELSLRPSQAAHKGLSAALRRYNESAGKAE